MDTQYDSPGAILPSLYVGSIAHACNASLLQRHAITHLLCLDATPPPRVSLALPCAHVPMSPSPQDDMELALSLQDCLPHIQAAIDARRVLLVFCTRGLNRSPAVCIGYLVSEMHWTLKKAYRLLQQRRGGRVTLHEQYLTQLQELEANLHEGECTLTVAQASDQHIWHGLRQQQPLTPMDRDDDDESQAPLTDSSTRSSDVHTTLDRASVLTNASLTTMRNKTQDLENFKEVNEDDGETGQDNHVPRVPHVARQTGNKKRGGGIPCCTQ
ncbi:Aste57867_4399 [Aphanomyces stellatus]|uniref:protein-tyrosine-phosphatase n=1 Tax=Aphanomyces stellatus TaxID=120398 RepID=A0A485KBP6_9STRA|nr:hypothetical protein As57867_004387 [Aphanomyces stellatus]VFT81511.1 Aste57867_4399 [Aphanomyces stellatus]